MRSIVLATQNRAKLREIRQVLADLPVEVLPLDVLLPPDRPEETGRDFAENARLKACYYARATGKTCLADDSGLVVDCLGGRPGVNSARYAANRCGPAATREEIDRANNAKLLEAMKDVPDPERTARFVCHLALADGQEVLLEATGTVAGHIARQPRGSNGFGYDPLFVPDQVGRTMAELSPREKNAISHRGKAVRQFARLLRDYLAKA